MPSHGKQWRVTILFASFFLFAIRGFEIVLNFNEKLSSLTYIPNFKVLIETENREAEKRTCHFVLAPH